MRPAELQDLIELLPAVRGGQVRRREDTDERRRTGECIAVELAAQQSLAVDP
jgi:hypothetical protein